MQDNLLDGSSVFVEIFLLQTGNPTPVVSEEAHNCCHTQEKRPFWQQCFVEIVFFSRGEKDPGKSFHFQISVNDSLSVVP